MRKRLILIPLMLWGCTLARIDVDVVSQRTALENQVLGTYNALDRQMLLSASVRTVDAAGRMETPPRMSPAHQDTTAAMQVLEFHADDLRAFKRLKWAGENNLGLVEPFPMQKAEVPGDLAEFVERYTREEFDGVTSEINRARQVVMKRVIELNENLDARDLERIQRIFGKLNTETARAGERIQTASGAWITKE